MPAQPPTAAELTTFVSEAGRAVKQLREERGMTKSAVAVEAGISPSTLARTEGGRGNPRASTLKNIRRYVLLSRGSILALVIFLLTATPAVAAAPGLVWSSPKTVDLQGAFLDLDCPHSKLCVAVDQAGDVVTTTNPTGPPSEWNLANVFDRTLRAVSCSPNSVCVAVTDNECPPNTVCPAVIEAGAVVATREPTGGSAAWSAATISGAGNLRDVDCTVGLCAALDINSQILTSTNPTGGSGAWSMADVAGSSTLALKAISCPSASLCVAVGSEMHALGGGFSVQENVVLTSTNPTGGAGSWSKNYLGPDSHLSAIDCPSATYCLVVDEWGQAWSSTDPTGGEAAWTEQFIDPNDYIIEVSCPLESFCAVADRANFVLTSTKPMEGSEAWGGHNEPASLAVKAHIHISCPAATLCVGASLGQVLFGMPALAREAEPPGSTSQPPASGTDWPASITLSTKRLLVVKNGRVRIPLTCQAPFTGCNGGIKLSVSSQEINRRDGRLLRPARVKIGAAYFSIRTDTTEMITIRLNKRGRKLLAAGEKVAARITIDGRAMGKVISLRKAVYLVGRSHH